MTEDKIRRKNKLFWGLSSVAETSVISVLFKSPLAVPVPRVEQNSMLLWLKKKKVYFRPGIDLKEMVNNLKFEKL